MLLAAAVAVAALVIPAVLEPPPRTTQPPVHPASLRPSESRAKHSTWLLTDLGNPQMAAKATRSGPTIVVMS